MEKSQRIINIIFLTIAGGVLIWHSAIPIATFPVVFLMGFDSPNSNLFTLDTLYSLFYIIFIYISGFAWLILLFSVFYFNRKRYVLSVGLCVVVFLFLVGARIYSEQKELSNAVKVQEENAESQKRIEKRKEQEKTAEPPSGYLIPNDKFLPENFKEVDRRNTKNLVSREYICEECQKPKMHIFYSELGVVSMSSSFTVQKSRFKNSIVYEFEYSGRPGFITKEKTRNTQKSSNYTLYWSDNGKLVTISINNFHDNDVYDPNKTVEMLNNLVRSP